MPPAWDLADRKSNPPWLALTLDGVLLAGPLPLGVHLGFRAPRVRPRRSPAGLGLGLAFELDDAELVF